MVPFPAPEPLPVPEEGPVLVVDLGGRGAVADELRVNARLADAAGDQLRVLAAEVDDEDRPLLGRLLGQELSDDSSGRPS